MSIGEQKAERLLNGLLKTLKSIFKDDMNANHRFLIYKLMDSDSKFPKP